MLRPFALAGFLALALAACFNKSLVLDTQLHDLLVRHPWQNLDQGFGVWRPLLALECLG